MFCCWVSEAQVRLHEFSFELRSLLNKKQLCNHDVLVKPGVIVTNRKTSKRITQLIKF